MFGSNPIDFLKIKHRVGFTPYPPTKVLIMLLLMALITSVQTTLLLMVLTTFLLTGLLLTAVITWALKA
jgi:hypothetical protein